MNLQFFEKNVNKQLKSADFFFRSKNFKIFYLRKFWQILCWCLNIPLSCKSIHIKDIMAKRLILSVPSLLLFSATSKPTHGSVSDQLHIVPHNQKWYPIKQIWILTHQHIGKIGLVYKSKNTAKKFLRNIDRNFCVLNDKVLGDTSLHYTHELSVTLSLLNFSSYSTHIQKIPSFFIKLTS